MGTQVLDSVVCDKVQFFESVEMPDGTRQKDENTYWISRKDGLLRRFETKSPSLHLVENYSIQKIGGVLPKNEFLIKPLQLQSGLIVSDGKSALQQRQNKRLCCQVLLRSNIISSFFAIKEGVYSRCNAPVPAERIEGLLMPEYSITDHKQFTHARRQRDHLGLAFFSQALVMRLHQRVPDNRADRWEVEGFSQSGIAPLGKMGRVANTLPDLCSRGDKPA